MASAIKAELGEAYRISDKMERQAAVSALRNKAIEQLATDESAFGADDVSDTFSRVEDLVRQRVLNGEPRIDGRDLRTVRPIEVELACCQRLTGLRCLLGAKRKRLWLPRWVPCVMQPD